ncbi:MAG: hypothetical protein H6680_02890 [Desulfobacteraceae bacterium]|nr:hypothetical protein [Desulfobacteraceae bacterium]
MDQVLEEIKKMAIEIVSEARLPSFYLDYNELIKQSREFFSRDELIIKIKKDLFQTLENNFGHGYGHAKKVAVEAGVIFLIEIKKAGGAENDDHYFSIAHTAGLLHDICRKEKNHAKKGAVYARSYLEGIFTDENNIDSVAHAIANHEAFCDFYEKAPNFEASVLSDSLYDSDKFRWGPDNFSHMLWAMLEHTDISAAQFMSGYERGINSLKKIKKTFRTSTGKKYGPEFIDIGIEIGSSLLYRIKNELGIL